MSVFVASGPGGGHLRDLHLPDREAAQVEPRVTDSI
jgi:hypothetical protein